MITILNIQPVFKFLVHVHDHRAKRNVHQIVDAKTPVKSNQALVFVHLPDHIHGVDVHHLRFDQL